MLKISEKKTPKILCYLFVLLQTLTISACANTLSNKDQEKFLIADFSSHRQLNDEVKHKEVQKHIKNFTRDPRIFTHLDEDRLVLMRYILNELKKRNMPSELAMIPLIESSYKPAASNNGKYIGLWQFGKQTAKNFGIDVKQNYDGRYNTIISTKAALDYLEYLNKMFKGDWLLTMAAYNAGEGRVLKSMKANRQKGKPTDYWSIELPQITRAYIPKVLALSEVISERVRLQNISHDEIPRLVRMRVESPEVLKEIIQASDIPREVIEFYNPNVARPKSTVRGIVIPENEIEHINGLSDQELKKYISYGLPTQS